MAAVSSDTAEFLRKLFSSPNQNNLNIGPSELAFWQALEYKHQEIENSLPEGKVYVKYEGQGRLGALFNTDGWSSTLKDDIPTPVYLPTGVPCQAHFYEGVPISMVRESFYQQHIVGKELPWVENQRLRFPPAASYLPILPGSKMEVSNFIGGSWDIIQPFGVVGVGLLPIIANGIPLFLHVLLVKDLFPNQPPEVIANANRFDAIIQFPVLLDIVTLMFASGRRGLAFPFNEITQKFDAAALDIQEGTLTIYIDGCCLGNGTEHARGGLGVFFGEDSFYNMSSSLKGERATNQRAELSSGITALQKVSAILKRHGYYGAVQKLRILSDSKYLVDGMNEWLPNWKNPKPGKREWVNSAGKEVQNKDLWVLLDTLVTHLKVAIQLTVQFEWIARELNHSADLLANQGALVDETNQRFSKTKDKIMPAEDSRWEPAWGETLKLGTAAPSTISEGNVREVADAWWKILGTPSSFIVCEKH